MEHDKPFDKNVETNKTKEVSLPELNQTLEDSVLEPKQKGGTPRKTSSSGTYLPGRPSKTVSKAAEIKESFFRAFQKAGGLERLVKLLEAEKLGKSPTKEKRRKSEEKDRRFLEFCYKVLPNLFPKKTELEVETRSVVFRFSDGKMEKFSEQVKRDDVVDIEFTQSDGK